MQFSGFSWLAVGAAIVGNMILGWLWYGPLFGKSWADALGKKMEDLQMAPSLYIIPILSALIGAIVLWNIMGATGLSGIVAAFWMWLGFVALTGLTNASFRGSGTTLWAIESGAHLVGFAITGLLLDLL